MADGRVVIEIELNDGKVVKGIANVDKQLKSLGNASADPKLNLDDKQFQKSMNTAMSDAKALDNSTASVFLNADNKMTPILDNAKLDLKSLDGSVSQSALEMNGADFEKVVEQAKIDATTLNKTTAQVMLSADDRQFKPKIETANFDIKGLNGTTAQTNLEMNVFEFQKAVDQARAETTGLDGTVSQVTLSANDKNFLPPIENAKIEIKGLDGAEVETTITADTKPLEASVDTAKAKLKEVDEQTKQVEESSKRANLGFMDFAKGAGAIKLVEMGMTAVTASMDSAITRFDTMQGYPKMMEALGYSAEDSSQSIDKLADGIDGLPTKLDTVVATSQRMTVMTGNLNESTDATLALNNAFLANGSSADTAARGTEQYLRMLATGEVNMTSWNTLQETMGLALKKTAEEMGYTGDAADQQLYKALQNGEVVFEDFTNGLIAVGTGTGEVAELAKINSEGIKTSFSNLANAVSKGVANVTKDFDNLSRDVTGKNIAQNLDGLKVVVNRTFEAIGVAISATTPLVKVLALTFEGLIKVINFLMPALVGLTAAFVALKVIEKTNQLIERNKMLIDLAKSSTEKMTLVLKARTAAEAAGETATKAATLAEMAKNGEITISTAVVGLLTKQITKKEFAEIAAATATKIHAAATALLKAAMNPLGGVIMLTVGALAALATHLIKGTDKSRELKKEQQELKSSSDELLSTIEGNSKARKDELSNIEASSKANQDLASNIAELANQENKSAEDKAILKGQIDQLNAAYGDLNLQYDEENDKLNMSAEALAKKVEMYKENAKMVAIQEQLVEIAKEQNELDMKVAENAEARKKYNEELEGSFQGALRTNKAMKEFDQTEADLAEQSEHLANMQNHLTGELDRVAEASINQAAAVQESSENQIITYDSLSESQQQAVDSMRANFESLHETATNAFDKINTDSEISMNQMVENMTHNQEAVRQWGENQAALLEWAGKNGHDSFIPFIESIGVDQAGVLAEMVQGVDGTNQEQARLLTELATTYDDGFGTAAKAGRDSMKLGLEGLPDDIRAMTITPVTSMNGEVRSAFEGYGKNIGQGAEDGINSSKKGVENATKDMANSADKAFTSHMQIKSPSRLFRGYGEFIGQGLTGGMDSQRGAVRSSSTDLSANVKIGFNTIESEMYSIGQNAMIGLNNGMVSNAGVVYSSAQTIANNVKNIIQSAMDIHSPSRWMKNFIGKNMMQGWADGLDQYAKLPVRSMEQAVIDLKLPILQAEQIVGSPVKDTGRNSSSEFNNSSSGNSGAIITALSEQNKILRQILNKETHVSIDSNSITDAVNFNNAINDSLSYFGG